MNTRLEIQFSLMNCQMFSTGFSSGAIAGSGTTVTLAGTFSLHETCQPVWSSSSRALAARRHGLRDFGQIQRHGLGRAARQHQVGGFALCRAGRPKDVGRRSPQIPRDGGPRAAPGPAAGDLVLRADPRLVGKPDLYRAAIGFALRDRLQIRWRVFLKAATAVSLFSW